MSLERAGAFPVGVGGAETISVDGEERIAASLEGVPAFGSAVLRRDIKLISNGFVTGSIGRRDRHIKDLRLLS
jgi:hypothetical protein